jgi:o-succinylbenzoate---CoA ligase
MSMINLCFHDDLLVANRNSRTASGEYLTPSLYCGSDAHAPPRAAGYFPLHDHAGSPAGMTSIDDPLARHALRQPDAAFAVGPGWRVSYLQAHRRVTFAASALRRAGLARGDRLALYDPEAPAGPDAALRTVVALLAAWRVGAVAVPLSLRLPPAGAAAQLAMLGDPLLVGTGGIDPELLVGEAEHDGAPPRWRLDDEATIAFTSGSTGEPRGVLHTLGNHYWSAAGWSERLPLTSGHSWLLDLPLNHVGGLAVMVRCVLAGATLVLPERGAPLADTIARFQVTHASLVATQLRRVLDHGSTAPLANMDMILLGGSAVPDDLLREAVEAGLPVATSYGMTEMASTVAATQAGAPLAVLRTAGSVLPHRDARLAADGEILLRGRTRFAGYVTAEGVDRPFDADGWFASGDLGEWVDTDGRPLLRITGRIDNLFISGGENVQPEAIEAVLMRQRGVRAAVVVPRLDDTFGQRPVAFIDADEWASDAWAAAVAAELPRFMVPDRFLAWPEGASGELKPRRAELARLAGR